MHDKPVPMTPSAKISGLDAGVAYHLLRFDEAAAVPASNFIAGSWAVKVDFVASGTEVRTMSLVSALVHFVHTHTRPTHDATFLIVALTRQHTLDNLDSIMSDGTYFYRTVRSP